MTTSSRFVAARPCASCPFKNLFGSPHEGLQAPWLQSGSDAVRVRPMRDSAWSPGPVRRSLGTSIALVMLVFSGCGSDADGLPEWRPEDHAQPEQHSTGQVPTDPNGGGEPVDPAEAQRRAVAAFFRMTCGPCHGAEG